MIVSWPFRVNLHRVAELPLKFVEGRLKPAFTQGATRQPGRRESPHFPQDGAGIKIGGAEQEFQWPGRTAPL